MSPKYPQAAAVVNDGTIVFGNSGKIVQHNKAPEDVATGIYDTNTLTNLMSAAIHNPT